VARGCYHSLYTELKADVKGYNPQPTPEQLDWRVKMRDQDNAACIVKGWEQAINIMRMYLDLIDGESLALATNGRFDCL
jgi:hypothetical protein